MAKTGKPVWSRSLTKEFGADKGMSGSTLALDNVSLAVEKSQFSSRGPLPAGKPSTVHWYVETVPPESIGVKDAIAEVMFKEFYDLREYWTAKSS